MIAGFGLFCIGYQISTGVGTWGSQSSGRLGVGYHQLRVLDRYRSRRNADFGDFVPAPPKMAHVDQPRGGSDDALRGDLRGDFSRAFTLAASGWRGIWRPVPNDNGIWPNFRWPLLWDVFAVSTYFTVRCSFGTPVWFRISATLRDRARSEDQEIPLRNFRARLARIESPLAALRDGLPDSGGSLHAAGALGAHGRFVRLRDVDHSRLAHDDLPALLRRGRDLRRLRDGADDHASGARALSKLHDMITPQHVDKMAKIILLTGSIVGYAYLMELFIAWYSGNPVREVRVLQPHHRSELVVLVGGNDVLQRPLAAALLVQGAAGAISTSFTSSACA